MPEAGSPKDGLADRLLAWFDQHRRDLPWRRDRDPYRIWVSEIMLQQTRVATVVPYFERFVARFPDVAALAAADRDDVLKAWEGLGYYRRVHHLKDAAELLVRDGAGQVPEDPAALRALPGIGRYTAGAIGSQAFGRPEPVVDGNVRRVLCRLWARAEDPRSKALQDWLWDIAGALIPAARPGAFNEALMELGATVCTDRKPRCGTCPLGTLCDAWREGDPEGYPTKVERKPIPHFDVTAGIIRRGRRILITRRRDDAMLGGLWEFPGGKLEPGESLEKCLVREIDEELAIDIRVERPFVAVDHAYTHFRITLHTFLCRHSRGRPRDLGCAAHRWVHVGELDRFAFPKADRVVLEKLREEPWI